MFRHNLDQYARRASSPAPDRSTLLEVRDLRTYFSVRGSFIEEVLGKRGDYVRAVDGVTFDLRRGEVLGLVGESGSGKTTLGRSIARLVKPTSGSIRLDGRDITRLGDSEMRPIRRRMQIVFQDSHAALNPGMDLLTALGHPLRIHRLAKGADVRNSVATALELVGLVPADQFMHKYPKDLSGGQEQRANLARAIIVHPDLLIADEPVSMLDVSVRAKILDLMLRLRAELNLTYLYITHDLATAKFCCDRIAIMYLGKIVEIGPTKAIFDDPKHPYTKSLLHAIPNLNLKAPRTVELVRGETPETHQPPLGCRFHPRCPSAFSICGFESRDLKQLIEVRSTRISRDRYEEERNELGDLATLDEPRTRVKVPAGRGGTGRTVVRLLETIKASDPHEPLWTAVREITAADDHAVVSFNEALEPSLMPVDAVSVACHLYDRSHGESQLDRHPV